ncbi:transposase [Desulfarculales bacterium]
MPQGKGKIERFFRTVRSQFLPGFKGDTFRDINEALECWVRDVYHQRKPLSSGQAPLQRFTSNMECVRPAHADLENYFRKRATRRVALDGTISLAGRLYEAPVPLIVKQIILRYHGHDHDRVGVLLENRSHSLIRLSPP